MIGYQQSYRQRSITMLLFLLLHLLICAGDSRSAYRVDSTLLRLHQMLREVDAGKEPLSPAVAYARKTLREARAYLAGMSRSKEADAVSTVPWQPCGHAMRANVHRRVGTSSHVA